MHVLITGATGFIGQHLCRALGQDGHTLTALSRNPGAALRRVPGLSQALVWDPLGVPPDLKDLSPIDAVVHLAGESIAGRWTPAKKRAIRESRVLGTRTLVTALESLSPRPRVLLSASATGYYGDGGEVPLTEESPPGKDFLAQVCVVWEEEARRAEALGIRVVCLRAGIVFGPGGGALTPLLVLARLGLGGPLGSGRQWWSWVHMDDLVGLVRFLLTSDLHGPVNAVSPNPIRQRELAKALGRVLRRPALLPTPGWALRLLVGEVAQELLFSRRVLPKRAQEAGYRFRVATVEDALHTILARG
ncbi:Epimerase family protein [bacterium HR23]|nr:Epimerase family protein [bacterium HR23]